MTTASSELGRPARAPSPKTIAAILFVGAVALFLIFFQWNWLRGPLAHIISARIHRPVRIAGNLEVHPFSGSPWARVGGVAVGEAVKGAKNAAGGPGLRSARVGSLAVRWRWGPLLGGRVILPLLEVRGAAADLVATPTAKPRGAPPARLPTIDHLVITDARVAYTDPVRRITFRGLASSDERRSSSRPGVTTITGSLLVGGADWAGPTPVVDAPRLTIQVRLLTLIAGSLQLPLIEADAPRAHLVRDTAGRGNWELGPKAPMPRAPTIDRLIIREGLIDYSDARAQLAFAGSVSTSEIVRAYGQGAFALAGKGHLNHAPFALRVIGGPLVNIDPRRPYPFTVDVDAGLTHIHAGGTIAHPFHLDQVSGLARVSGADLADLYTLTRVALPATPPYDLAAAFARHGESIALRRIAGRMGGSDLEGSLDVEKGGGRPYLRGALTSRVVRLADLTALAGGVPKHTRGQPLSPVQRVTAARLAAEHRIFPDSRLQIDRIRGTDADVTYTAGRVDAGRLPLRALYMKVRLDHGALEIAPMHVGLPQGDFASTIRLDARGAIARESIDARLTNARLEHLMPPSRGPAPIQGSLFARARLTAAGDSVRAAAASVNGSFSAAIPGGQIRQAFAELLGIDATKGLFLLLTKNQKETPIRCGVIDFQARDGVLTARRLVLDTGVVLANGSGDIDLRNETLNLRLSGKPKKFRLVRIGAPITLKGYLAAPKPGLEIGKAAPQVLVGVALGAVLAPVAALLPFINPGLAKNADCAALVAAAR